MKLKFLAVALIAVLTFGGCAAVSKNNQAEAPPPVIEQPLPQPPTEQPPVVETPQPPKVEEASYIKVTGANVNLRSGAGTGYAPQGTAEENTLYTNLGKEGDWYKTKYKNKTVYISAKYCAVLTMEKSNKEKVEAAIAEGYNLMGVKYVYGAVRYHDGLGTKNKGFTLSAFDCSSLTQYVFYKGAGKLLQVTTRTQVKQGTKVTKANLQRGDLMFFTNESRYNKTGMERIGHVAIYLGKNYILHTASDYAKIEQISAKRWSYFIEGRRMV